MWFLTWFKVSKFSNTLSSKIVWNSSSMLVRIAVVSSESSPSSSNFFCIDVKGSKVAYVPDKLVEVNEVEIVNGEEDASDDFSLIENVIPDLCVLPGHHLSHAWVPHCATVKPKCLFRDMSTS